MPHTLEDIYQKLLSHFGPQHWWPGDTPFEICVGAILTQNTAWSNVEKAIAANADIIGINNRDLHNFKVDLNTTQRLSRLIPKDKVMVSESGIKTYEDVMFLKSLGVNAVLIGEAFMEAGDIAAKMREIMRY